VKLKSPITVLPYGKQSIDEDDIQAVVQVLRSDWLTTGPMVSEFEGAFAQYVNAREAVAVTNGTAALHAAMFALGIGPGDEVIVPALTFAATANSVVYQGGTPVFADVEYDTLLVDPKSVEARITPRTKAIIAVDYAGQPCDYDALTAIADRYGFALVADACHALGGTYRGRPVGSVADLSTFSLHPVKPITAGEGGVVTTDNRDLADRMRMFRNHGITTDHRQREEQGSWFYEMTDLGYNYRLTDIQCALGMSQLKKLPSWLKRRWEIAAQYDDAFDDSTGVTPLGLRQTLSPQVLLRALRSEPQAPPMPTIYTSSCSSSANCAPRRLPLFGNKASASMYITFRFTCILSIGNVLVLGPGSVPSLKPHTNGFCRFPCFPECPMARLQRLSKRSVA